MSKTLLDLERERKLQEFRKKWLFYKKKNDPTMMQVVEKQVRALKISWGEK